MAEGLFDPADLCPPGVRVDTLRAAVVRILPRTPLHLDIVADRETAHKLARNELQDDGSEHWFRYFTDADRARCDDPLFALGMVNHEFCQVVKRGDAFPASVMLDGGGTGVAVSAQGHVLTNFHLATGEIERLGRNGGVLDCEQACRHLRVQWAQADGAGGWHWVDAEAVHVVSNPPHADAFRETADARYRYRLHADVALLRIEPAPSAWLPLSAQSPLIGAPVWMAGYPLRTARAAAARAAHGYHDADGSLRHGRRHRHRRSRRRTLHRHRPRWLGRQQRLAARRRARSRYRPVFARSRRRRAQRDRVRPCAPRPCADHDGGGCARREGVAGGVSAM